MELLFFGFLATIICLTGLWKVVAPIFFVWWLAFIISEHKLKKAGQKRLKITAPQIYELQRPVYTVNYFGPVW